MCLTLQMSDVAASWSERVAVLGRSYLVMQDAIERILLRLSSHNVPVSVPYPGDADQALRAGQVAGSCDAHVFAAKALSLYARLRRTKTADHLPAFS